MQTLNKFIKIINKYRFNWRIESTELKTCYKITIFSTEYGRKYHNVVVFIEGKDVFFRDKKGEITPTKISDIEIYLDARRNGIDEDIAKGAK